MTYLVTFVHVVVALFLIVVVLLQRGKRADLAGAFGGGGSQTAFGTRGAATVLSKATTGAAVLFMVTSISLAILSSGSSGSSGTVLEDVAPESTPAPATGGDGEGNLLPALPPEDDPLTGSGEEEPPTDGGDAPAGTDEPNPSE